MGRTIIARPDNVFREPSRLTPPGTEREPRSVMQSQVAGKVAPSRTSAGAEDSLQWQAPTKDSRDWRVGWTETSTKTAAKSWRRTRRPMTSTKPFRLHPRAQSFSSTGRDQSCLVSTTHRGPSLRYRSWTREKPHRKRRAHFARCVTM